MAIRRRRERLKGPLDNALGADINPRTRGHLAVHHEAFAFELQEVLPIRPATYQVGIGDQNPGRIFVSPENPDRLAGLDQERLIVRERL